MSAPPIARAFLSDNSLPVHQVEVHIVQTKVGQRALQGLGHLFGSMEGVPQLGRDKELFARNTTVADRLAHFLFVAVYNAWL